MKLTVQHILDKNNQSNIFTTSVDTTVQDAIEIMAKETISALPVINKNKVVGIISERDYIRKAAPKRLLPWNIKVSEIMTNDVISANKKNTIDHCMRIMSQNRIRHLPVIENDELVGMISITDVIRALRNFKV